ncbi:MAG: hypothetical protein H7838_03050 [Magnetococcus sp. DMHC-8]
MQITEGLLAVGEVEAPAIVKSLVAQGSALPAVGIKTVTSQGVVGQAMNSVGQAMNSLAMGGASGGSAVAVKGVGGGVTKGLGFGLMGAWGQVLLIGVTIALGVGVCNYLYRGGSAGWRKVTEEIPEE